MNGLLVVCGLVAIAAAVALWEWAVGRFHRATSRTLRDHLHQAVANLYTQARDIEALKARADDLAARNEMLTGLVAKDPERLAELGDFHTWRAGDLDAHADRAIGIVSGRPSVETLADPAFKPGVDGFWAPRGEGR